MPRGLIFERDVMIPTRAGGELAANVSDPWRRGRFRS